MALSDWESIVGTAVGILAAISAAVAGGRWLTRWLRSLNVERRVAAASYDKETIARALRYYVRPLCSSIDPAQEAEPRGLVVAEESVFAVIDKFLTVDTGTRHLVLLADSGMGKTSFLLNYFARNYSVIRWRRRKLVVVHLGSEEADLDIAAIPNPRDTDIFLDALDEDTRAIEDHRARLAELLETTKQFRRLLLTSRTQFFPSEEEIPVETGIVKVGPRGLESPHYRFRKLYLSPLNDRQVKTYLRKRFPIWEYGRRRRAWELVKRVPLLSVRPMLLTYMPELLEADVVPSTAYEIYGTLVDRWYVRESSWCDPSQMQAFSQRVAVEMISRRTARGSEWIRGDELADLAREWNINLADWQARGRSLLNRDAVGRYKFAHRSIMEFLFSEVLIPGVKDDRQDPAYVRVLEHIQTLGPKRYRGPILMLEPFEPELGITDQVSQFVLEGLIAGSADRLFDQAFLKVPSLEMRTWREKQFAKLRQAHPRHQAELLSFSAGSSELWLVKYGASSKVTADVRDYTRGARWTVTIEEVENPYTRNLHGFMATLATDQIGVFAEDLSAVDVRDILMSSPEPVMRLVDGVRRAVLTGSLEEGGRLLPTESGEDVQIIHYLTYAGTTTAKISVGVKSLANQQTLWDSRL